MTTTPQQTTQIEPAQTHTAASGRWAKDRVDRARAEAERFFSTDEDLPLSSHTLLTTIALFCILFVVWASVATLDEVTRGDGRIIPSSEVQVIQNLEGGIVEEFLVHEGDEVQAGQVLLRLRDVAASSDLGSNRARYLGLLATVTRLQAEAEGKPAPDFPDEVIKGAPQSVSEEINAFRANRDQREGQQRILQQQLEQRKQEAQELRTKISDLSSVLRLSREEKAMIAPLVERGSAPKVELVQLERAIREKEVELNGAQQALPRAESAISEAKARFDQMETEAKAQAQSELAAKMTEMSAIKESLSALSDRKTRTEIRSPVRGMVKDIKITTVGGVVKPGEDVIEIVPTDDQLLVEARIRPSDIAFLYPGQPATVKITAYDFSIYGGLKGELVDISPDAITNEKGESFYRVRLRTSENALKRKDQVLPIKPGMVASVDILTGKKTVMEYILKPLIKTVSQSMHER